MIYILAITGSQPSAAALYSATVTSLPCASFTGSRMLQVRLCKDAVFGCRRGVVRPDFISSRRSKNAHSVGLVDCSHYLVHVSAALHHLFLWNWSHVSAERAAVAVRLLTCVTCYIATYHTLAGMEALPSACGAGSLYPSATGAWPWWVSTAAALALDGAQGPATCRGYQVPTNHHLHTTPLMLAHAHHTHRACRSWPQPTQPVEGCITGSSSCCPPGWAALCAGSMAGSTCWAKLHPL